MIVYYQFQKYRNLDQNLKIKLLILSLFYFFIILSQMLKTLFASNSKNHLKNKILNLF